MKIYFGFTVAGDRSSIEAARESSFSSKGRATKS
jgi:hypothetical protein